MASSMRSKNSASEDKNEAKKGEIHSDYELAIRSCELIRSEIAKMRSLSAHTETSHSHVFVRISPSHPICTMVDKAIFLLNKIVVNMPATPETIAMQITASHCLLGLYFLINHEESAIPTLEFQIKQKVVLGHYNLALVYLKLGEIDKAILHFQKESKYSATSHQNLSVLFERVAAKSKLEGHLSRSRNQKILAVRHKKESDMIQLSLGLKPYEPNELLTELFIPKEYIFDTPANIAFETSKLEEKSLRQELVRKALKENDPDAQVEIAPIFPETVKMILYQIAAKSGHPEAKTQLEEKIKVDRHKEREKAKKKKQQAKKRAAVIKQAIELEKIQKQTAEMNAIAAQALPSSSSSSAITRNLLTHIDRCQLLTDVKTSVIRLDTTLGELKKLIQHPAVADLHLPEDLISKFEESKRKLEEEIVTFDLLHRDIAINNQVLKGKSTAILEYANNLYEQINSRYLLIEEHIRLYQLSIASNSSKSTEEKTPAVVEIKESCKPIYTKNKTGNIYYPLEGAGSGCYARFNKLEYTESLQASAKDAKATEDLVSKAQAALIGGRLLPSNAKKAGMVAADELDKFPGGFKLWISADERIPMWRRDATTAEKEEDPQIQHVWSPRGAKAVRH